MKAHSSIFGLFLLLLLRASSTEGDKRFCCSDGKTSITSDKVCDGDEDCPLSESGPGGEDEEHCPQEVEGSGGDWWSKERIWCNLEEVKVIGQADWGLIVSLLAVVGILMLSGAVVAVKKYFK